MAIISLFKNENGKDHIIQFVMNNLQEIIQANKDFNVGKFGYLEG